MEVEQINVQKPADVTSISHDHPYGRATSEHPTSMSTPVKLEQGPPQNIRPSVLELTPLFPIPAQELHGESNVSTGVDDKDTTWRLSGESDAESDMPHVNIGEDKYTSMVYEKKYMVFDTCLDNIMDRTRCEKCCQPVDSVSKVVTGTNVVYTVQYLCNHPKFVWSAQSYLRSGRLKIAAGNVLMPSAVLYTGLTY